MVVDLSKYDGDSFEAALDVFYGVMDDLKTQAADGKNRIRRSPTYESKGRCSHMETIVTWFNIACAVVSIITIFINLWLNS